MSVKAELRRKWDNVGKDVVVIHSTPRAKVFPNLSPYPIKLETFCRMADIRFVNDFQEPFSSKGKTPWMTFNGKDMADSQHCIEHLKEVLPGKDLDEGLSVEDKAVSRAFRALIEDHIYFCLVYERWIANDPSELLPKLGNVPNPDVIKNVVAPRIRQQVTGQGLGLHTKEEVAKTTLGALKAISDFLGSKDFMMGSRPTEIDATAFGFMCMYLFTVDGFDFPFKAAIERDFNNIAEYTDRMKERFWPDWNECIKP